MKILILFSLVLLTGAAGATTESAKAEKAEELYRLVIQLGQTKEIPYEAIAALPAKAESAHLPPAAVDEIREIARELEYEMKRLEKLLIEALTSNFSEEELHGLVAFAKSELGRKVGQAAVAGKNVSLTSQELKQLQGFAKISFAWKFSRIPRRLAKVNREMEKSVMALTAKVKDFEQRYSKK